MFLFVCREKSLHTFVVKTKKFIYNKNHKTINGGPTAINGGPTSIILSPQLFSHLLFIKLIVSSRYLFKALLNTFLYVPFFKHTWSICF